MLATLAGAVLSGVLLGWIGSLIALQARIMLATVLALVALIIGWFEWRGRLLRPLQCDRETPRSWVDKGPFGWAIRNGLALGCGATSRIGFWFWYIVPLSALLIGNVWLGALIYGLYGASRGMAVWLLIGLSRQMGQDWDVWLVNHHATARYVSAALLICVGVAAVVVVGL